MGVRGIAEITVTSLYERRPKIIGIDPGTAKCGYAVVYADGEREAVEIVPTHALAERIERDVLAGAIETICVGNATTSDSVVRLCRSRWPRIKIAVVDEHNTTFEARREYYKEHPPRGLLRLVPRGLLVPSVDLDGYAALLIIERYRRGEERRDGPEKTSRYT
jgi:RNase H-fold protein (predicted Holliday junction resolvase)